jgi:lipopolysaccharide transport system ATP-binding protein
LSEIAVKVEHLSKRYRIGVTVSYKTLRESVVNTVTKPFHRLHATSNQPPTAEEKGNHIWALKDASFEIEQGQAVGVIGKNGSGKSTLLKILSRITRPTEGHAEIHGRIGSLLEVGTGFHPELSGRENIYLNGAILGMKRKEIENKFKDIVDFSGVEKFIDTPLKRYSSGMQVRLAFAIAAHLEPDILLVDEVLAVGDAEFQKKSLGRMGEVAKGGRTVILVSHNMNAISLLCNQTILLHEGKVAAQGPTPDVVAQYLSTESNESGEAVWKFEDAPGSEIVKLRAVRVVNERGETTFDVDMVKPVDLEIEFWCLKKSPLIPAFHLYNQLGALIFFTTNLHDKVWVNKELDTGLYRFSCKIPENLLNEGTYFVNAYLSRSMRRLPDVSKEPAVSFRVHDYGTGQYDYIAGSWVGIIRPLLAWTGERISDL